MNETQKGMQSEFLKQFMAVHQSLYAYIRSAVQNTSLELGLFWQLPDEPQDAAGAAETPTIPANRFGC